VTPHDVDEARARGFEAIIPDPGPATDADRRAMHVFTSDDVNHTIRQLTNIRGVFEQGSDCRTQIDQTIEILYGLQAHIARGAAGKRRSGWRHHARAPR
jgi:hypothetical protein